MKSDIIDFFSIDKTEIYLRLEFQNFTQDTIISLDLKEDETLYVSIMYGLQ